MNTNSLLLLTKDAQCKAYYPMYGNSYWKSQMPNMEELADKGTVFNKFYTAAPSSNMSYLSMFTMKYPYQQEIKEYVGMEKDYEGTTFFNKLNEEGYKCHIIWDDSWNPDIKYARCYNGCIIHGISGLKQGVGCHYAHSEPLQENEDIALSTLKEFEKLIEYICNGDDKVFIWCHLPHVLNGRVGYGGDMDLYDKYLGVLRKYFVDDNIFISADHGNMNGAKGKVCYGFDVYEEAINIPLITPRINNMKECNDIISNIDLWKIILDRTVCKREYILSDSAYYAQPRRKLAIVYRNYKYIYNKIDKSEELYDLSWDPSENFNLISDRVFDGDRKMTCISSEYYFYPLWNKLPEIRKHVRAIKDSIWREETGKAKKYNKLKIIVSSKYPHLYSFIVRKLIKIIPRNL